MPPFRALGHYVWTFGRRIDFLNCLAAIRVKILYFEPRGLLFFPEMAQLTGLTCRSSSVSGETNSGVKSVYGDDVHPDGMTRAVRHASHGMSKTARYGGFTGTQREFGLCRLGKRRGSDRGAVAVEAAFIFPLLVLILFGIIEFSLFLRDHVALAAAVRSGARTASAEPRMSTFGSDAAGAVLKAGTGMPFSTVQEMWVYEANAGGYPTNGGSASATTGDFNTCTTRCMVYTYSGGTFTKTSGTWDHTLVNACPGDAGMTNVGVRIKAHHGFVTGLFGTTVDITDHAVLRFEPIPASQLLQSGQCKP